MIRKRVDTVVSVSIRALCPVSHRNPCDCALHPSASAIEPATIAITRKTKRPFSGCTNPFSFLFLIALVTTPLPEGRGFFRLRIALPRLRWHLRDASKPVVKLLVRLHGRGWQSVRTLYRRRMIALGHGSYRLNHKRLMQEATHAAPKPLSILTTVTLEAQEFSIPNNAATPPKLAP
jgi:hypothetical protein